MTTTHVKLDTSKIPAQREFMQAIERELLYSGAFGAGKSRIGCEKGLFLSEKYPGNRGLVIRKTYTDLRDTTMDTWFRYVCPQEHILNYNKQEHHLILKNGSEVLFHGMENYTKVGSLEVGWVFIDELIEFTEEEYLMLLGRLRHPTVPFHQIFGATNPGDPRHWAYKRFYLDTTLQRTGVTKVIESNTSQNVFNPKSYIDSLNTFKGRYKERFVEGKWVSFEGVVYDCWQPNNHILPRDTTKLGLTGNPLSPIPPDWEKFRSIDFGFTNPFTCQWWASPRYEYTGPEGRQDRTEIPFNDRVWVMYREIYHSGIPVDEHTDTIRRLSIGERYLATIADWDAGDRAILQNGGVPSIRANKDVSSGLQEVYSAIASDRIYILENSLHVMDTDLQNRNLPTQTLEEFSSYMRPKGKDGKYNPREDPLKVNDHGMDALRYLYYTLYRHYHPSGSVHTGTAQDLIRRESASISAARPSFYGGVRRYGPARGSWRRFG